MEDNFARYLEDLEACIQRKRKAIIGEGRKGQKVHERLRIEGLELSLEIARDYYAGKSL